MYTADHFRERFKNRKPDIQGAKGHFSVLMPVIDIKGEAHILYELRSNCIDRQPGEVCFPGGEIEKGETPLQAVIRETEEETGLTEKEVDIIAELDTYHPASGIVIYPFLGEIKEESLSKIKPDPYEVAEVFLVPVSFFFENEPYRYEHDLKMQLDDDFKYEKIGLTKHTYDWRPMKNEIISWEFEGKYIWGLTAQITSWNLRLLTLNIK